MISRIWHGWTTPGNADTYEALLKEEIFVGFQDRHIRGFNGIQLLRREVGNEVEFVTIMLFGATAIVRLWTDPSGSDISRNSQRMAWPTRRSSSGSALAEGYR
jgi:hypothetical protein